MARRAVRVIGPGRAGLSLLHAFEKAGWRALAPLGRGDDASAAAEGCDLVVLAVPDPVVAEIAAAVDPVATTVVAHVSGALTLDPLARHPRRASLHPLRPLATTTSDLAGAWFAVSGDPLAAEAVADLGGRAISVADEPRARVAHHAAAVVASNHLVALLDSVERIAADAGVPLDAYLDLVRATIDNVEVLGPERALTGPVARGDWTTVARHLDTVPASEAAAYRALAAGAARLAGRSAEVPW
ncbi:MAG TPA: DUF2520 domain-containing protein [Acidimicrobiales bacterium]|nr:DUF2520 domain-containing protein [Acidimicrobiales bacterium]